MSPHDEEHRPEVSTDDHASIHVRLQLLQCHICSWSQVFEQDLFAEFERRTINSVKDIIAEIKETAPYGLQDRCGVQGELSIQEAGVTMKQIVAVVADTLQKEQKEISRCLAPHIQAQLRPGYQVRSLA